MAGHRRRLRLLRSGGTGSGGGRGGRTNLKPILLALCAGYFFQKWFRPFLLPHGPPVPHGPARYRPPADPSTDTASSTSSSVVSLPLFGAIDTANDSLRLKHGRTYRLYDARGSFRKPETVISHPVDSTLLYTMTADSKLVRFRDVTPSFLQRGGDQHQEQQQQHQQHYNVPVETTVVREDLGPGRPLGGRWTLDGRTLYIADAVLGLTRLSDLEKDPHCPLEIVASSVPILLERDLDPKADEVVTTKVSPFGFVNSIEIGPRTGKIYFTDSTDVRPDRVPILQPTTSRWGEKKSSRNAQKATKRKGTDDQYEEVWEWDLLYASKIDLARGRPTGRVCEYDPNTNRVRVIADQIHFANGIGIDPEERFLVVAETFGTNLLKYDLTRLQQQQEESSDTWLLRPSQYLQPEILVPAHEIPGYLDNVHCAPDPTMGNQTWCYAAILNKYAAPHRYWRMLPVPIQLLLRTLVMILHRSLAPALIPKYTGILVVDPSRPYQPNKGEASTSSLSSSSNFHFIQDPSGIDIVAIAGVFVNFDHTKLYLGSIVNDYIGVYLLQKERGKTETSPESNPSMAATTATSGSGDDTRATDHPMDRQHLTSSEL